jgi:uncharacterized SAM-binding protein YcdF (DUF218 family)
VLAAAGGVLLAAGTFFSLGHLIANVNRLAPADAIYVLGGSRATRALEAPRLYREGYAPRIVLSPGGQEFAERELARQGIELPSDAEIIGDLLVGRLGLPKTAVLVLPRPVDNTAHEAEGWTRVIVITDRPSTRRTGHAFRRVFGNRLDVVITCSRDDPFEPGRWWAGRWSVRATFHEVPKLLAYWAGLGA